ncbi:hypothetical protein AB0M79_35155 [Polymorphospora sp. NPDC051019]|uniref:hypothetical protein n=1 Tax=Polymorphospora sp. NPDC051019 TaxID=3155725 RepID=UPI00342EBE61
MWDTDGISDDGKPGMTHFGDQHSVRTLMIFRTSHARLAAINNGASDQSTQVGRRHDLVGAYLITEPEPVDYIDRWSTWRRRHQLRARRATTSEYSICRKGGWSIRIALPPMLGGHFRKPLELAHRDW